MAVACSDRIELPPGNEVPGDSICESVADGSPVDVRFFVNYSPMTRSSLSVGEDVILNFLVVAFRSGFIEASACSDSGAADLNGGFPMSWKVEGFTVGEIPLQNRLDACVKFSLIRSAGTVCYDTWIENPGEYADVCHDLSYNLSSSNQYVVRVHNEKCISGSCPLTYRLPPTWIGVTSDSAFYNYGGGGSVCAVIRNPARIALDLSCFLAGYNPAG